MYKNRIYLRSKRCVILGFIFGLLIVSTLFQNNIVDQKIASNNKNSNYNNSVSDIESLKNQADYYNYTTKEWLTNGNFTGGEAPWYNTTEGDTSDVKASYGNNAAEYSLLGNSGTFTFVEDVIQSSYWTVRQNPYYPAYPYWPAGTDQYAISGGDFWTRHQWVETARQTPSVQWYRKFELPINMSDYEITSIRISGIVYASVDTNIDCPGELAEGDNTASQQGAVYDHVRFYISIADPLFQNVRELAYNQTKYLGLTGQTTMPNTFMNNYSISTMKESLNTALSYNYKNFSIIVGFDIFCEDNCWTDRDEWDELRIRSLSFNFTYVKKMNQLTSLSWNQIGNKLSGGEETQVTNANLKFKYKINETLSSSISSNSEIRMIINETQHSETVKLWSASTSWNDAKTGGFDVTSLIKKNVNIALSIQVYLAENFQLSKGYKISIDNVSLLITYSVRTAELDTSLNLYLNKQDKTQSRYLEISRGENVNITVKYYNTSNSVFLDADSVNLTGFGTPKELYKDSIRQQYNITINTTSLAYGENYFKITAIKSFYETQEITFTLDVVKRDTYLEVYVDNNKVNSTSMYETTIGKYLNITVYYRDSKTNNTILGAKVQYIDADVGTPENLTAHPLNPNLYNITKFADDIEKGISFIQITGEKDNYTKASLDFSIFVEERDTDIEVFINGTTPPTKYIIELEERINITANFTDGITHTFIPDANVSLIGYDNLTRVGNLYNITLSGLDLKQQGINFLTIYAYKENYKIQSYTLVVEVVERQTNLHIFFDGVNVTTDPSTASLPFGKSLTISARYFDKYNNSIVGADVRIIQDSIIYLLSEDPTTHIFSTTINTIFLGIGITVPYLIAERVNFQTKTENLRIQVRKINTLITTDDEKDTITVKPGEKVNIKIEVRDLDFGGKISECEVTYDWKYGDGELDEEEPGVYEFSLENVPEGTHKITITVYKSGGLYEFQEYEITLNVVREEGESLLYMILFIAAMVGAGGLGSYFVAYYYVLKYPKPVRKVRKYRRTLKRTKSPKTEITSKEKAFNELYKNRSPSMTSLMKAKSIEKIPPLTDKIIKKSIEEPTK